MKSFKQFIKEAMGAVTSRHPSGFPPINPRPPRPSWVPWEKPKPTNLPPSNIEPHEYTDPETGITYLIFIVNGVIMIFVPGVGWMNITDPRSPFGTSPIKDPEKLPDDEDPEEQPTITPDTDPDTEPDGGPDQLEEPNIWEDPSIWPDGVWPHDYNGDGVIDYLDWLYARENADYIREYGIGDPDPDMEPSTPYNPGYPPGYPPDYLDPHPEPELSPFPGYTPYYGPGGKLYYYNPDDGTWIPGPPPLPPLGG